MNVCNTAAALCILAAAGCLPVPYLCSSDSTAHGVRTGALDPALWEKSEWISAVDAPVFAGKVKNGSRAADGTSWFVREIENADEVVSAKWMTAGLGVYELYVNGTYIGEDALKPGFTHVKKTRRSFTYDITDCLKTGKGQKNFLAAEVSAGWWRDKIVNFAGKKSAFRAVLELVYADGTVAVVGTKAGEWTAGTGGPVTHAAIFDGEEYDARVEAPYTGCDSFKPAERNDEFRGEILPSEGGEVVRRRDLALLPESGYVWKGVDGADEAKKVFGTVHRLRDVSFRSATTFCTIEKGETLVIDFGQNCAGVPFFRFAAKEGTTLTCLPAEMLNDGNGERARGNDGPAGSVYRENLRCHTDGMRIVYTFGAQSAKMENGYVWNAPVSYWPTFTFFGYRYLSITATDTVHIQDIVSVPVTSIAKEMEIGKIETGVADVNKLIANVYWGQLSNYLSVPTDCPQRNERLGWMADTQVFAEAGSFNADTSAFLRKFTRDIRDTQDARGGFPGVAPYAQYGNEPMRLGWADAGVIVPYQVWKQFGDTKIVDENWAAMEKYLARLAETKGEYEATKGENGGYQWADWLSYEDLESCSGRAWKGGKLRPEAILYWNFLYACYWHWDALMMQEMAAATGKDADKYAKMAAQSKEYVKRNFFEADGLVAKPLQGLQTPALFALKFALVEGEAKARTIEALRRNFAEHGDCLQTGFLGTSILMETLSANGMSDIAYTLLLQHKNPSWLYSVDQGATTIWERWNSYTKERGFGPVGMNSFNHYAYGAVLAWIYKDAAGIAADPKAPGFRNIVMAPKPDRRLGYVNAEYRSAAGLVKSAWRYAGDKWIWDFTIPEGATADVTVPGESVAKRYTAGTYHVER